ncbi:MAG TPA: rRNA maturation RNase YbeY [Anaerolineales bacterium]|nr:rRNA maturation RNase YbeY [Anaerolineales bacterium]
MIYIEITDSVPIETSILEQAAALALQHEAAPANAELTVVIGDDQQLHKLNQQYRSVDAPTDVLSFPAGYTDPDSDALYLGDVIISLPRAQAQAAAGGHDLADELQLLVVHGVLHLLGHDHGEADEKQAMQAAQDAILKQLGCKAAPKL